VNCPCSHRWAQAFLWQEPAADSRVATVSPKAMPPGLFRSLFFIIFAEYNAPVRYTLAARHLWPKFRRTQIAAGGFRGESAAAIVAAGADLVAFGRHFTRTPTCPNGSSGADCRSTATIVRPSTAAMAEVTSIIRCTSRPRGSRRVDSANTERHERRSGSESSRARAACMSAIAKPSLNRS
jgi:hypothetical protein